MKDNSQEGNGSLGQGVAQAEGGVQGDGDVQGDQGKALDEAIAVLLELRKNNESGLGVDYRLIKKFLKTIKPFSSLTPYSPRGLEIPIFFCPCPT